MVFQFMGGILSTEGNEELMDKLMNSLHMDPHLLIKCLSEYRDKDDEFTERFIRNHPQEFCAFGGCFYFEHLSDVDSITLSFMLDIISELNKGEAGEAQHKCSDNFVAGKKVKLVKSKQTLSRIKRVCGSLNKTLSCV